MRKIISLTIIIISLVCLISLVSAENLEFRLDVNKNAYYPNEKVHLNVSVVNRDEFSAKDAILLIHVSDRFYSFNLGDMKAGDTFNKEIILSEFPPGTQNIQGDLNYTGFLDERFTEVSYGSFEVLFPPIERYPRNIFVVDYSLPDKVIAGKNYDVSATIKNDGDVNANLLIEFGYLDEYVTENVVLNAGQSKTITKTVKFNNPGVSLMEARVYAMISGEKYLLNYKGKGAYAQEERVAKLSFDKLELVEEFDNQINQEDTVNLRIFLKNEGETATGVIGYLSSNNNGISILNSNASYSVVGKDETNPSSDLFKISTKNISIGNYTLNLKVVYTDSENREKIIDVPITISAGGDSCIKNSDCGNDQKCDSNRCVKISCECGEIKDHICNPYECCNDQGCKGYDRCDINTHTCIHCIDEHCCASGTMWCEANQKCTTPLDCLGKINSPCKNIWPAHDGKDVWINEKNSACDLFEVIGNDLKYIPQEAAECCQNGCSGKNCHQYCDVAYSYSNLKQGLTDNRFKKCVGLYITYGLGPASKWMHDYYNAEIQCSFDNPSINFDCTGNGQYKNTKGLLCQGVVGTPEGWASDDDMSKNSCIFSDLPAHASINKISTGTCVDYSVSLTTLFRMGGYSNTEVYSVTGPGHEFNLVKFPGDTKWTFVDTVGNSNMPYVPGSHPTWFPYCDYYDNTCANDFGQGGCPSKSEIYGC